jgi:hypothetical protein
MATCETCRNSYDKSFQITMAGAACTLDSFEHAITALAPYCCAYCARTSDVKELRDRA